ncbi:MAG: histidine phosphatase family protein [Pseudomonadota bacterium]|nr:histidine phosphatase family protein [Pseudomonadota bacterium]
MTTTLFLVRHGVHDQLRGRLCGRSPGVLLAEAGLAQAEAAGRRLAGEGVELVLTSPLERTRQTAERVARACDVPMELEESLMEIDFGDWNGRTFDSLEAEPAWQTWNRERDTARPPSGESMAQVQARLTEWLDRLARTGAGAVAAVSHADVIKAAVGLASGLSMRFHDRFEISPGSITTLVLGEGFVKLHALNEVPHG